MELDLKSVLEQIVQGIASTMLDMQMFAADAEHTSSDGDVAATVQIAGEWTGGVLLRLSGDFACAAASAMLQIDSADVTAEDCRDAAGELSNMVGGNLKSLLPGPSFLSLPTVVAGHDYQLLVHDAVTVDQVVMVGEHGTLLVQVYAPVEAAASAATGA
ncbi:MAG: chemotaxis protein CheX [Planctomycetaceae bacterium]|nr:chemotaxis protein CheX [Planctomycetaceae bacterium]